MPFSTLSTPQNFAPAPGMLASGLLAQGETGETGRREAETGMSGILRAVPRDQEIYGEDDNAEHFFKVVSGVVRLCKFLSDGRRQVVSFHFPGDVFGVETGATYRVSAEAVSDCTLLAYRRRNLDAIAAGNEDVARQMFLYAMRSAEQAQEHTLLLGRCNAVERVACFLRDQARHGDNGSEITLEMSRNDIADYLGLTMETVSRTLSRLERDRVIELTTSRNIRIRSLAALRATLG